MVLWNCSKILIRLGQGCQTGCNGCNERYKKTEYFDVEALSRSIIQASKVFSNEVRFFLFWQDPLISSDVEEIIGVIRRVNQNEICIHMADIDKYDEDTYIRLERILEKHVNIWFYISTSIETMKTWKPWNTIKVCQLLSKYHQLPWVQIYYDAITDLKIKQVAIFHHMLPDSHLSFTQNIVIAHDQKTVSDNDMACKFHETIGVDSDTITFSPPRLDDFEFEVTYQWDIIPHTPRCYMARIFISNVFLDESQIHEHFTLFRDFIYTTNTRYDTFEKNCYSCIFGGDSFDYRKLWK